MKTLIINDNRFININNVSMISFKEDRIYIAFNDNTSTDYELEDVNYIRDQYTTFLNLNDKTFNIYTV